MANGKIINNSQRGYVMKKAFLLFSVLFALALFLSGCGRNLGQTTSESNRNLNRTLQTNMQELKEDFDKVMLLDKPSTLSEKRIP